MNSTEAILFILFIVVLALGVIYFISHDHNSGHHNSGHQTKETTAIKISSNSFQPQGDIPSKYTCDGENISPSLNISGVPQNAASLALIVDDPDSPSGQFTHWLVWNINPIDQIVVENSVPVGLNGASADISAAVQGTNDFGKVGYGGPCPGSGKHRYQFKLYALDSILNLPGSVKKNDLQNAINGRILVETVLTGLYQRK